MIIISVVFLLGFFIFIKTLSYGIYETKQNSNTLGGIIAIVFAVSSLILPSLIVFVNGFY